MVTGIRKILTSTLIILAMFLVGCQERPELSPSRYDLVMQYPTSYADVPVGVAYEFGVSFQRVPADAAKMCLLFDEENLTINYNGRFPIKSGQEIEVSLNNDQKRVSFTAIGKQTGVHKVEAFSQTRTWSAGGSFNITVKNNAYIINLIDEVMPTIRVGEQQILNIEAVDVENPSHKFHNSPGFTVSARSLGGVPTIIDIGAELTWNNFIAPFDSIPRGLTWQDNKFSVMYRSYQAGEQHIEFTIKSPRGEISRTVHTLHVDSTRVNLTPNRTASDTVSVTDAYEVNYKVDYLRHPHNQLSCMWEPLEPTDPYSQSPKLFLDGKMDAKAGEWGEYRRTDILGFSAYPIAPNKGGRAKQGFRLHVQDMFGWDTTLEYRFDVKMSEYDFRVIPPTKTPLLQNNLYSFQFELSNYYKGKYRYKFVRTYDHGVPINPATLYDYVYSEEFSTEGWYNLDLSGSDGKPFLQSVQVASPYADNIDVGIKVIIEDEFGVQQCAYNSSRFEPNAVYINSSQQPLSLIVGQSTTFNISLAAPRPDNLTFENATLQFDNYEPLYESIEVDGQPLPSQAPYSVKMKNKVASIKYTSKSTVSKELQFNVTTWAGQSAHSSIGVSSIIDCGNFTATPDKASYELPYSEGQVSQDIAVTLASDQELAGLYDYNSAFETGTKISCSVTGNNNDRVVAIDNNGGLIDLKTSPQLLKYAVGKTIKLRHYATKSASASSLNSRVTLTVVRKDGRTTQTVYSLSMTDCGNFTATPDKAAYEIPYSDSRVSQDIAVSLASEREVEGLYDYNSTSLTGTKLSYTSGGNKGRVVAVTAGGREIELSSSSLLLDYAVGKTLKLRHYPDATVNGGSIETIRVTVTRRDGALSQFECKITAEDKAFVVEKFADWSNRTVNGRGSVNVCIRNLSKYYKGSYSLHSSDYRTGHPADPNVIPTLTQELPLPKAPTFTSNQTVAINASETADRAGKVEIGRITIADDNGMTAWYENDGTDVYLYVNK